jgi:hypothetical protein
MWTLLRSLLVKWTLLRVLLQTLASLGLLVPLAFILKMVGLPILAVLGVLALPVLLVLAFLGLPFFLVFLIGGALLGVVMSVLSFGLMALKVVLPILLVVWLLRWLFFRNGGSGETPPATTEGTEPGTA